MVIAVASAAAGGVLAALTGYGHSPGSAAFEKLPLWLITLIVLRAGVVEELFYRGYAIERLQAVGLKPAWAAGIPLVIFALGHWDRPQYGGLYCKRLAEPFFLSASGHPQVTVAGVADDV